MVGLDKVAHFCMYACFAFLCLWGYRTPYSTNGKTYRTKALGIALAIGIAYGGLTEIMQEHLVPKRIGDWYDFAADSIGSLLGVSFFALFFRHKK